MIKSSFSLDGYEADTETLSRRETISTGQPAIDAIQSQPGECLTDPMQSWNLYKSTEMEVENFVFNKMSETDQQTTESNATNTTTTTNLKRRGSVKELAARSTNNIFSKFLLKKV